MASWAFCAAWTAFRASRLRSGVGSPLRPSPLIIRIVSEEAELTGA